jgi:hypothetical protein
MRPKQTVFLSSVTPHLGSFQNLLYEAINRLDDFTCLRLDDLGDTDSVAGSDAFCRAIASDEGIFILILSEEYGAVHTPSDRSYAEREYEAAVGADKPRMLFLVPEQIEELHAVQPAVQRERQLAFQERVRNDPKILALPPLSLGPVTPEVKDLLRQKLRELYSDIVKSVLNTMRESKEWEDRVMYRDLRGKTWLLFPFLTNQRGWDGSVAIANISLDPTGTTKPQQGPARLYCYGKNAPAPQDVGPVPAGTVFTAMLSSIAPGVQGYLIAECDFYPARGLGATMRLGGSDLAMYVAEVLHTQPPKKAFFEQKEVESVAHT